MEMTNMTDTQLQQTLSCFITDNLLLGKRVDLMNAPSFLEAGIVDSTGVLELVQFIEDTWGIAVKDEEMVPENLDSLPALERFIRAKTAAMTAPSGAAAPAAE